MTPSVSAPIRLAADEDLVPIMRLLDAAVLEADASEVRARIEAEDVLVAESEAHGRIVGALVLDEGHIDAIAVQKERRGRGIGGQLVEAASARVKADLTADFDDRVRPFYASLGFEIREREGRYWARRRPE